MRGMAYIHVAEDGRSARIGGGTQSGEVIAALWSRGKQAGMIRYHHLFVSDLSVCTLYQPYTDRWVRSHSHHRVRLRRNYFSHAWRGPRLASGAAWIVG